MTLSATLEARDCPTCGAPAAEAAPWLEQSFDPTRVGKTSFASRKDPELMSWRLLRCAKCATVFASPAPSAGALAEGYHEAAYDSALEARQAAATYHREISPHLADLRLRGAALEIGTGTGVFLEFLQEDGFATLIGVEPSTAAIAAASPVARPWIRTGVFQESDFAPGSLSLLTCFMTLEHVREPRALVAAASRLLAPGGMIALVTHDYQGTVNRALGKRSPIIDIEHMQLFCRQAMSEILAGNGFERVRVRAFSNRYHLAYWMRLLPLPAGVKRPLITAANATGLGAVEVAMNVGNIMSIGFRPGLPADGDARK